MDFISQNQKYMTIEEKRHSSLCLKKMDSRKEYIRFKPKNEKQ